MRWAACCCTLGRRLRPRCIWASDLQHMDVAALWYPLLEPMTIGAFPLGIVAAVILYFPIAVRRVGLPQRQPGAQVARKSLADG